MRIMLFKRQSAQFICVILCLVQYARSVDHSNFKTCEQSSFCRRCRKMEPGKSEYELDLESLKTLNNNLFVQIMKSDPSNNIIKFNLRLTPLEDNTLRLQVEEANPLRQRYFPHEALPKEPVANKFSLKSKTENIIELQYGNYVIELHVAPFRLDIKLNDIVIISANPRGLFRFEHTIKKPEERDETEDPGTWEENFKTHHDSKPYGPTAVAMDISFPGAKVAYGLPEHADSHALRTTTKGDPYRFYNLDVFEYELNSVMAIYASIPFLIAHSEEMSTGILWLNPSETWVDVSDTNTVVSSIVNFVSGGPKPQIDTHFMSESGNIDVFFTLGPLPQDVFRQYSVITGTAPIPPEFSLGFHQCRWNYNDQEDVDTVDKRFDEYNIPMDVMWLDIEHTDNKKYFTWDPLKFSDPITMQHNLTARGRKLVAIVDPHIKRDPSYFLHNDATENGYYVKNKDNSDYEGWCWSGSSSYVDFINPILRQYYASRYRLDKYQGSTKDLHIWNDMNEPSVFNGPEITMPKDNIHYGGWEHREVHNVLGLLNVMTSYDGLLNRDDNVQGENRLRPFILTRSAFPGSQRYAAIWTGDNAAEWSHLTVSLPMCLSLAVAGYSFCGADVGGFFNNPDRELFLRWHQAGVFLPFFRAHAHHDAKRREPWLFDDEVTDIVRDALNLRYSLIPHFYTLFYEHNTTGAPVIRPLWSEFPTETDTFNIDNQLLVGSSLLARPVTEPGVSDVSVYFPGPDQLWYDIETFDVHTHGHTNIPVDLHKIPAFQRGGSIIPRKLRIRRSSTLMKNDPYTLFVALDSKGKASGHLYIDDGETFKYLYRKDSSLYLQFTFEDNKLSSKFVDDKRIETPSWLERVVIVGLKPGSYKATAVIDGQEKPLETIYGTQKSLTIRKPGFNMAKEWLIKLN